MFSEIEISMFRWKAKQLTPPNSQVLFMIYANLSALTRAESGCRHG